MSDYVVHSISGLLRTLASQALVGAILVGVLQGHRVLAAIALVAAALFGIQTARRAWVRLAAGPDGILLCFPVTGRSVGRGAGTQQRAAAWSSVRRVVILPSTETVRVVLKHDAPMPAWLTRRVIDPTDAESGVAYERQVPGLDPVALESVVRACSPGTEVRTDLTTY